MTSNPASLVAAVDADVVVAAREVDRTTLLRAQLGDPRAFATIVRLYEPRVRLFVGRMCGGNPAIVDDMLQDTFLRVFRGLHGFLFDGRAQLSTWIMTIATRTVIDERRRAWSRLTGDPDVERLVDKSVGPEGVAASAQLRRRVDLALLDVSEPLRAAFALRVFCELSEQETADVLGVDVGTVKSRVSRVRAHLRRELGGQP